MKIVLLSSSLFELCVFTRFLLKEGNTIILTQEEEEISSLLSLGQIDAIIGDEQFMPFIQDMITAHPMVPTAMISSKSEKGFHQITEGLGILMQLPPLPEKDHAVQLLEKLSSLKSIKIRCTEKERR